MIKTPLRYPGGKTRISKKIINFIPQNIIEFREPFVGGGSIFIESINNKKYIKNYWINDIYQPLCDFWKHSLNVKQNKIIVSKIKDIKIKYSNGRNLFNDMKYKILSTDSFEKAYSFFILNRITFSGTIEAGGYSEDSFNGRFTDSSIYRLEQLKKLIKQIKIKISNEDYEKIILSKGSDVFIFLDPPYYSAQKFKLYGKNGENHKSFDFIRLRNVLKKTEHKWLMTIDDFAYIRQIFDFAYINTFNLQYGMGNSKGKSKIGKELFISNYLIKFY